MNPIDTAAPDNDSAGTVCIAPQGDGSFMVYRDGEDDSAQPAADLDAALEQVRALLGGAATEGQSDTAEADELFSQGFNNARGTPLNGR